MPVRVYKPMTNGLRGKSTLINDEITKTTPEKSLVVTLKKNGGRNNQGRITVRHQGAELKENIVLLILDVTKMALLEQFLQLNTIQIELLTLL